jgi:hypothetical protein
MCAFKRSTLQPPNVQKYVQRNELELSDNTKDIFVPSTDAQCEAVTVIPFVTERRPNAPKNRRHNPSKLGLLIDEVVEGLQGALQPFLTDFDSVPRHFISADLDQTIHP